MQITSKGQVTIPQDVRNQLGFLPHTEVEFEIGEDYAVIRKLAPRSGTGERGRRALAALRGTSDMGLTTEQIMAMTRGEDAWPEGKE